MMGTIYILLDGVFLLLLFAYLTRNTEAGKAFGVRHITCFCLDG